MNIVGDSQGPASGPDIVLEGGGLDGPGNAVSVPAEQPEGAAAAPQHALLLPGTAMPVNGCARVHEWRGPAVTPAMAARSTLASQHSSRRFTVWRWSADRAGPCPRRPA